MPNQVKDKNTGRKRNVLGDELRITGAGVYSMFPFSSLDRKKSGVMKVGESSDLVKRTDTYHTYFPAGLYMLAFLTNIKGKRVLRGNKAPAPKAIRQEIELFIIQHIVDNGGKRLYSTDRVRNPNRDLEGRTEWVYTNVPKLHEAFNEAGRVYNADVHLFYLEGLNPDTGKIESVLNPPVKQPTYTGKVVYHVGGDD